MRITRVYTRTGDKGSSSLADGTRIAKDSLRLESYGTIDELNAIVGLCRQSAHPGNSSEKLDVWLEAIQNDLFNLGGDLATPFASRWEQMILIGEEDVKVLEQLMDECQLELTPLREFVLPGGTGLNAFLHLARTVCRRAERLVVTLQNQEEINPFALPYLNRLSDFFFVVSRWVQVKAQAPEVTWNKKKGVRFLKVASQPE